MVGLILAVGLLFAATASATYEQVATFRAEYEGKSQFFETGGMAVNVSGAGGVPAGTVYVARPGTSGFPRDGLLVFSAQGEFLGEWEAHLSPRGVAVDQATGNVYVLMQEPGIGNDVVKVFSPDGSQLLDSFAEAGAPGETVDEGPEKLHNPAKSGIAVDSSGTVYVTDLSGNRVMVFEPSTPGDFEHYVYAGRSRDLAVGLNPVPLAVDSAGNLYTAGAEETIYEFAPGQPGAPICELVVSGGGLEGLTVNPKSGEVFFYSYRNQEIHQLSPCNPQGKFEELGSVAPVPRGETIEALAFNPELAYESSRPHGTLYAAEAGAIGNESAAQGEIFAQAEVLPPAIESESVSAVGSSTATLGAQINPKGAVTRYSFQYISDAAYQANEATERFAGASEAPLGGALLGTGQSALSAATSLAGLAPDSEYHYRVIATSHCDPDEEAKVCEAIGAAEAFRTFPAETPNLADGRAYELVSPTQKNGGEVIPAYPLKYSCARQCKPNVRGLFPMQSSADGDAVVYQGFPFSFTEGAAQSNQYVSRRTASGWQTTTLSPPLQFGRYVGFDVGLTNGILSQEGSPLSPGAPSGSSNLYTQPTATPTALTPLLGSAPPHRNATLSYAGASADFSRQFFAADDALTAATPFAPAAVDGGEGANNLYEAVGGQLRLVNVLPGNATAPGATFGGWAASSENTADFSHAISADGSRVFWSAESGQVYVRDNGEETREIPDHTGRFLTASADGSRVLLDDGQIYNVNDLSQAPIDLTQGKGGFQGILGQSEDLSSVYFAAAAALVGGTETRSCKEEEEKEELELLPGTGCNLYAWHEGTLSFIAVVGARDGRGDWVSSPAERKAEASPDGRWATFLSRSPLTGQDSGPCTLLEVSGPRSIPCEQVFLYDSATGKLSCPSCDPSNARPPGASSLPQIYRAVASFSQLRYLTDSGRLYFDSQGSLSPFDTNHGVEDVYQYEPDGVGGCRRAGGCVSLISAGREAVDSNFLAADASGKNVFFTTRDQLVPSDRDDLIDLYDAREGGGIAAATDSARSECQGEACQPPVSAPDDPLPASSTFEGSGNVKKPATKRKRHSKKHRHARKHQHRGSHGRTANNNRGGAK